ncbi:GTP-binding protein EngB [Acrasis kona]|uniref:GTP-binding protein EngB n=1 Tax=Acrasis kona TaxID=1008807 RepID=A0AAW2Z0J0_9EUKA
MLKLTQKNILSLVHTNIKYIATAPLQTRCYALKKLKKSTPKKKIKKPEPMNATEALIQSFITRKTRLFEESDEDVPVQKKPKPKTKVAKVEPTKTPKEKAQLSTKDKARLESAKRERWHLRQKKQSIKDDDDSTLSQNQKFKRTPIKPEIISHIYKFGLPMMPKEVREKKDTGNLADVNIEVEIQDAIIDPDEQDPDTKMIDQILYEMVKDKTLAGDEEEDLANRYVKQPKQRTIKYPPPLNNPVVAAQVKLNQMPPNDPRRIKSKIDKICHECSNWVFDHKMRLVGKVDQKNSLQKFINGDGKGYQLPQIAFAGRSNVGKSSLVNSVTGRTSIVTSDRPGETQSLNFYRLGHLLTVVDLPGYGFAYAKEMKKQEWGELMKNYFVSCRGRLKVIYLLIDSRHGLKSNDCEMIKFFVENNVKFKIVMTKTDLVLISILAKRVYQVLRELKELTGKLFPFSDLILASSYTKSGIGYIKDDIVQVEARQVFENWQKDVKKNKVMFL